MDNRRISKVGRLIQKELGELIRRQTQSVRGLIVSVTRVTPSPDLSFAKVYLSVFPSEKGKEILETIQKNSSSVRYELGLALGKQLRVIPELVFVIDDTLDYLENIDRLLKK